jgi:hypothetical protein
MWPLQWCQASPIAAANPVSHHLNWGSAWAMIKGANPTNHHNPNMPA